jgi:hypothetical protein
MTGRCITCGGEVGERIPELTKARARLGLPDDPPKRCPACIWGSLLRLADDDETAEPAPRVEPEKKA